MSGIFAFKCSQCGKVHEGSPSYSFNAPAPFNEQTEEVRARGFLNSDLCTYEDEDGPHHFIRVCLEVPIHGVSEPFLWGVWVSLSKESFDHYVATFDDPEPHATYFGWFCNYLPYYENTYALKTTVRPQSSGQRPLIELEEGDHPLMVDFHQGISVAKAQAIAEALLHRQE